MSTRNLEKFTKGDNSNMSIQDEAPQVKTQQQKTADVKLSEEPTVKFNKKLLDFDYGDEEDEEEMKVEDGQLSNQPNALALSMAQNLLSNPELLRQLQQMQQTIQQNEALKSELAMQSQDSNSMHKNHDDGFSPNAHESPVPPPVQAIPFPDQQSVMQFQYDNNAIPFPPPQQQLPPLPLVDPIHPAEPVYQQSMLTPDQLILQTGQIDEDDRVIYSMPGEPPLPPQDLDERAIVVPLEDIIRKDRSRSDSRSRTRSSRHRNRSKSPRRRKSRSRSRSRSRRNRSRSRDRERERMREKDNREREKEREKEHERRKRGIPPIKKNCMSVCSTTLWLGHVPKTLSKVDISSTFEDFGTVLSINMIPPRGCAYVVMDRRQDGHRALQKLKNLKLQGSTIKMAWAPGKGVKGKEFKEYWEVDLGVSYIPHEKIPNADTLDLLEEGGFIDEESMPQHLRELREAKEKETAKLLAQSTKKQENDLSEKGLSAEALAHHAAVLGTHMMPNSSLGMPMVLPQLMQPQYGMPMPGLMPHQAMMMSVPMGVPPPNPMMMVQPPSQSLMGGQPLPGTVPQVPHLTMPHPPVQPISGTVTTAADSPAVTSTVSTSAAGDATPTDEDGTSVSSPSATNAVQTLPTMVSATSMPQDTVTMTQFNSALGPHSVTRSMIPGMPPVSSAGAPIPFPPPHVSFGFPPPPIRPGQGPGMPPGCSAPFPWLHKASAPAFANFTDSDVRFASVNALTVRPVPPLMGQQASLLHPSYGIRPPAEHLSVTGNAATPPMPNEINKPAPGQKGKEGSSESQTGKPGMFGGQSSGDAESANRGRPNEKGFEQMGNLSPRSHEKDQDVPMDEDESSHELHGINPDFHREDVGLMPRFPGPPDFHSARGPMKGPWMRGPPPGPMPPGSRFHGMPPFQQRGSGPGTSRGMHPRMEMEFFHHQGPPGSRMHMGGPHGHPSRVSGNNGMIHGPPPPMHQHGQEWFPNRREFFDEPHFEREGQDRRFRQMDDWGHGREPWDDRKERNEDENKWGASEQDWKRDDKSNNEPPTQVPDVSPTKVPGVHTTKAPDVTLENINREERSPEMEKEKDHGTKAKQRPPETLLKDNQNWAEDMFRLKFYARDKAKAPRFSVKSFNRKRKSEETFSQNQEENKVQPEKPQQDSAQITIRSIEINNSKPEHIVSEKSELEKGNQVKSLSGDSMGTRESTAESRSRRDRDRKRSRWGRTLSQEREFQQQRINEIEMKFQSYEFLHPVPTTDTIENGNTVAVKTDVENIINPLEACNDSIINQDNIVSTHNDLTSLEGTSSAISHTIAAVEDSSSAISHITAAVEDSSAVSLHVIASNEYSSAVGLHDAIAPIEDSSDVGLQNAIAHIEDSSAVGLHNAVPAIEDSSAVGLHKAAPSIEDSSAVGLHNAIGPIEDSSNVGLHNDTAPIEDSSNAGVHNAIAPIEDSTVDIQNAIDAMEDNCTVGTKNTSVTMEDSNSVDVHNINSSIEDSSNVGTHDTTVDIQESSSVDMHSNVAAIEDSVINEAKVSSIVEDHSPVQDMSAESSADTTDQEIPSKLAKSSDASVLPVSMES